MLQSNADRIISSSQSHIRPLDNKILSPRQLLTLFRRNCRVILCCGLVVGIAAYLASKTLLPQKFTADATVRVETRGLTIPELQGALSGENSDATLLVRTITQILTSRALVQAIVEELDLTADPEFNAALQGPPIKDRLTGVLRDKLPRSIVGKLTNIGLVPPAHTAHTAPPLPDIVMSNVVAAVWSELGIISGGGTSGSSSSGGGLVIDVEFTSKHPEVSAKVVNLLISRYMADQMDERVIANRKASTNLQARAEQIHVEIERLEQRIRDTRERYNLAGIGEGSIGQRQLEQISAALIQASSNRAQLEANYQRSATLVRTGNSGANNSDALSQNIVGTLRNQEATAERRAAQLQKTLGPGHPLRIAAEAQLASARSAVISEEKRAMAEFGAQVAAARDHEAELRDQLSKAQAAATTLSSVQSELQQLGKDVDTRRALYKTLIQSAAQSGASRGELGQSGIRVVDLAITPLYPSSPAPKLAGELGFLSGCAFGGLLAVIGRGREAKYTRAVEVTADTGLAVMVVLPRTRSRQSLLPARIVADPSGSEAEALRSLRGRLRLAGHGSVPRSVLFVGSAAGEGYSSVAAAFARMAALDGLRVLLVEGDLQTPKLANLLGLTPSNGLVDSLNGNEHWPENVARDNATAMDLLLVGSPQPAASQLLGTMQLQSLMAETRELYNLVVVDGHPVTHAPHSQTLANVTDAVVLVVSAGTTGRKQLQAAAAAVSSAARGFAVAVLSQAA